MPPLPPPPTSLTQNGVRADPGGPPKRRTPSGPDAATKKNIRTKRVLPMRVLCFFSQTCRHRRRRLPRQYARGGVVRACKLHAAFHFPSLARNYHHHHHYHHHHRHCRFVFSSPGPVGQPPLFFFFLTSAHARRTQNATFRVHTHTYTHSAHTHTHKSNQIKSSLQQRTLGNRAERERELRAREQSCLRTSLVRANKFLKHILQHLFLPPKKPTRPACAGE